MNFSLASRQTARQPHYSKLLTAIVLRLLVIPFLGGSFGEVVASFLLFSITVLIIESYRLKRSLFIVFAAIATFGFFLDIVLILGWVPRTVPLILAVQVIYFLFLGSAALLILQRILQTPRITMDIVRGGICVYLLLGYFWAILYGLINTFDANAFSHTLLTESSYLNTLYFSFITLTTLGFGDIVPVNDIASVLVVLEALVGQIYPTVFIGILVSGYLAHRHLHDK